MVYKAIGLMSGSSLDGLDIAYVHFQETAGKWTFEIKEAGCYPYNDHWNDRLSNATLLPAEGYLLLHSEYGHYLGQQVNHFIHTRDLHHKVDLVSSHGHTSFHMPSRKMTGQLGDGAAIASETGLPVISDLRAMDMAFGGQGAPLVPIGEKLLLHEYDFLLNLGGIANLSARSHTDYVAFDVCPANRVLNMLASEAGHRFDENGNLAARGKLVESLLEELNSLPYFSSPYPKSLSNDFGTGTVYPLVKNYRLSPHDALRTYVEHVCQQVKKSVSGVLEHLNPARLTGSNMRMLVSGGGAHNAFLVSRLRQLIEELEIELVMPDKDIIDYKEAMIMALIGVLRWREEYNVLASVTGAARNSIGGALWIGGEA